MSLSSLATLRQTQAMLDQKRLSVKYGLPQFIGFAETKETVPSQVPDRRPPPSRPSGSTVERDWEIVAVDSKVTESNSTWWKYAWKLTLHNSGEVAHAFNATIEFQDKDGFIVDTSRSDTVVVPANADETLTGYGLIRTPGASNVARTLAKVAVVR